MEEIKHQEFPVSAEDGRLLLLSYVVLADRGQSPERYGIKVVERISGEAAEATDLTTNAKRIYNLADKLAEHTVTPTTLPDIVADLAFRKADALDAEALLRKLGVTGKLKGFSCAAHMIRLVERDPMAVTLITKRIYPDTAKRFGLSASAVERNLRTVVQICWERPNQRFLDEIAGARLCRRPTNSEFLGMTASYLRKQDQG